jgi:hypothetical protein
MIDGLVGGMMVLLVLLRKRTYESLLRRNMEEKAFFYFSFFEDCILTSHGYRRRDIPDLFAKTSSDILFWSFLWGFL